MGNHYKSLEELKAHEVKDVDYEEMIEDKNSKITIISIHGVSSSMALLRLQKGL